jgi:hypothetical protein
LSIETALWKATSNQAKMQNQFLQLNHNVFVREQDIRWLSHYQPPHEQCIIVGSKYAIESRSTFYVCEKDFPQEYNTLHQWYKTKVYVTPSSSPK